MELSRSVSRDESKDIGVGGERQGDLGELIDSHAGRHRDGSNLSDFAGPLADDVAAEDFAAPPIDDQFAEAELATVDDGPHRGVKIDDGSDDFV